MILTELHNWGKELGPLCWKNLGYYFDLNTWFRSSVSCGGSPTGMDTISPFGLFYLTEVYLWASIRSWICFVTYDIHRSNNKEFHRFNHQGTTSPSTGQQKKEEENSFKNERKTTFAMNLSPYFEKIWRQVHSKCCQLVSIFRKNWGAASKPLISLCRSGKNFWMHDCLLVSVVLFFFCFG